MKSIIPLLSAPVLFSSGVIAGPEHSLLQSSNPSSWVIYPLNKESSSVRLANNLYNVQDNTVLMNKEPFTEDKWTADTQFMGSSMTFWYTKRTPSSALDTWDGLTVVVKDNIVSGFLNDGKSSFNPQHNLEKSFFTPCSIPTKPDGEVNVLGVSYQNGFFRIKLNGKHCFQSDKITLFEKDKQDLFFGISHGTFVDFNVQNKIVPPVDEVIPELHQSQKQADEIKLKQQELKLEAREALNTGTNVNSQLLKLIENKLNQHIESRGVSGSNDQLLNDLKNQISELYVTSSKNLMSLATRIATLVDIVDQISPSSSSINLGDHANDHFSIEQGIELLTIKLNSVQSEFEKNQGDVNSKVATILNSSSSDSKKSGWVSPAISFLVAEILLVVAYSAFKNKYIKGNLADYHAKMI